MSSHVVFPVGLICRKVGPGAVLCEALFFPEVSRLAATPGAADDALRRTLSDLLPKLEPGNLLARRRAVTSRPHTFTLPVDPPRKSEAWRTPVELRFHAAVWEHPAGFVLARVPELGIEVIAGPKDDLDTVLRREALAALRRANLTVGLRAVAGAQATSAAKVEWAEVTARIPSLKEREARADADDGPKEAALDTAALRMHPGEMRPAFGAEDTVQRVADALTAKPPQSVLLVGPSGVGKTAAVRELVRRKADFALAATPFFRTSGARIVAGQTGLGVWEQRCRDLVRDAARKRAVLHLGNLVELIDVGKSEFNSTGIASFLRPSVARGELLCVAECTPEQIPVIEKEDPQLLDAFRQVAVDEPDPAAGRAILAAACAADRRREPTPATLAATDRLHRRYATYSAYPGRPLRFLANLRRDAARGEPVAEPEVYDAFARETGLPRPLIDPAVPLDLSAARAWFAGRVVGQPGAVELVVDLLATVKAGLTRPNRPVASLLFIGPTGVGKTEMAKALAEFLFGSKDRLTRFDMSEYADPVAVRRLAGGACGQEGVLTARVREEPFCVLLLDEIEKADPSVFDLLLQALGEARLTDAGGRLADFRNAVVVMTSNLGAESFRAGRVGLAGHAAVGDPAAHFAEAVERALRPEMFNRLDRVVPFAPLGPDAVRRIADREWRKVLARDGVRLRGLAVTAGEDVLDRIAAVGIDPRYGARPLKRAMERELLAPLARQINRHPGDLPLSADITAADGAPRTAVRPVPGPRAQSLRDPGGPPGRLAADVQALRRWHQLLEASSVARELDNDVYQLSQAEKRVLKRKATGRPLAAGDQDVLARLGRLREVADEVRRQREAIFELEDEAVVAFHAGADDPRPDLRARLDDADRLWDKLLLRLYALNAPAADRVVLAVFSENRRTLDELASAYRAAAKAAGLAVELLRYALPDPDAPPPKKPPRESVHKPGAPHTYWHEDRLFTRAVTPPRAFLWRHPLKRDAPLGGLPDRTLGVAVAVTGAGAHVRFAGEGGVHDLYGTEPPDDPTNHGALVLVHGEPPAEVRPDEGLTRKGAVRAGAVRRAYHLARGQVNDYELGEVWTNLSGNPSADLIPVVAANMRHRLAAMIRE